MKKLLGFACALLFGCIGIALTISPAMALAETSYFERGGTFIQSYTTRIDYDSRKVTGYSLFPTPPGYQSSYTCGITAGGIIIAYYNKDNPDLIPGHSAGGYTGLGGGWSWATADSCIGNMFSDLNDLMAMPSGGVTISSYLNGMEGYVVPDTDSKEVIFIYEAHGCFAALIVDYSRHELWFYENHDLVYAIAATLNTGAGTVSFELTKKALNAST